MKGLAWVLIVLLMVSVSLPIAAADWETALDRMIAQVDPASAEADLHIVLQASPDWRAVVSRLERGRFEPLPSKDDCVIASLTGKDGIERPYVLYVPPAYESGRPSPLLVVLHGGVSRKELKTDPLEQARKSEWIEPARKHGWLVLFPFGQAGATWWDDVGMDNIRRQIRMVKSRCNVDDDRVWLAGFSDGASAGFLHGMVAPSDFAAIVALNGHLGVGSLDGNLPTYAPNLAMTPVYAVTTDRDSLYPTAQMGPVLEMARRAGGALTCRELPGEHKFDYAPTEIPRIANFLTRHPRDPFPAQLYWEAGDPKFGRCRWFVIDEIVMATPAAWHQDFNATLIDDRVSIGFVPEPASAGVGVGKVMADGYGASIGLQTGDLLIAAAGRPVKDADELDKIKATVKRGDVFPLKVQRASATIELPGRLPPPKLYYVFKREAPSAAARVVRCGNRFTIDGSCLGKCRIRIHPEMVDLERPVQVLRDGRVVFDALVKPDLAFILRNYLAERDRRLLDVAEIGIGAK